MAIKSIILLVLISFVSSCSMLDGRLYTNKVIPYSEDFKETPIGSKVCYVDDFKVKEPVSGYNISAEWMTSSVIEQARQEGISKIYYADLRVFSILMGIYSKKTLIVYGD